MCKEFSRIVCVSLFSYQGSLFLSLRQLIYFITSVFVCQELFSSFFKLFKMLSVCLRRLVYVITLLCVCQQLFYLFSKFFKLFLQNKHFLATAQLEYHFISHMSIPFSKFFSYCKLFLLLV